MEYRCIISNESVEGSAPKEVCSETTGKHGRMLTASVPLRRGDVVIRERSICLAESVKCSCSGEACILPEHLMIAMKYADNEEDPCSDLGYLCSGATDLLPDSTAEPGNNQWPISVLLLMSLVSAIHSIVTVEANEYALKAHVRSKCIRVFNILCRLPQNLHGIDSLIELKDSHAEFGGSSEIRQSRLGIGLFRIGSSINHSCDPNCLIRFDFSRSPKANNISALKFAVIEVIACRDIAVGEECCISYGPICGRHDRAARQSALKRQYLFTCQCTACMSGLEAQEEHQLTDAAFMKSIALIEFEISKTKNNKDIALIVAPQSLKFMEDLFDRATGSAMEPRNGAIKEIQKKRITQLRCEYYDYCAYIYASAMKNYLAAIGYVERCIYLLVSNNIYSENDIAVARERVKLAELCYSAGLRERAAVIASRAYGELFQYVDSCDPDLVSATHIMVKRVY